jgi:hypothetical protein
VFEDTHRKGVYFRTADDPYSIITTDRKDGNLEKRGSEAVDLR